MLTPFLEILSIDKFWCLHAEKTPENLRIPRYSTFLIKPTRFLFKKRCLLYKRRNDVIGRNSLKFKTVPNIHIIFSLLYFVVILYKLNLKHYDSLLDKRNQIVWMIFQIDFCPICISK